MLTLVISAVATVVSAPFGASLAQESEPPLVLEAVVIEPTKPAVDTLCKLKVTLRNSGAKSAYAFGFDVLLNGKPLEIYDTQLFLLSAPPGKATEIPLFNFWTTETGRPAPADGKLAIEVRLREAKWVEIETVREGDEEVEVWTPAGEVPGLPVSSTLAVKL